MERRNFTQILKEAKVDIRREYDRLYSLFFLNKAFQLNNSMLSLRDYCACFFYSLPFRGTCLNLDDFDDFYGFNFEKVPTDFDLNYLLSFCEYSYNLAIYMNPANYSILASFTTYNQQPQFYVQQVMKVVDAIGYMITKQDDSDDMSIVVAKSPAAMAVAEISDPKMAYKVLEYNHYALKGNLDRKLSILKVFADEIEPRRAELKKIPGSVESELFQMLQKFIRHNNRDNPVIAAMSDDEIEAVYDDIYQMWLLAMLELDNVERKKCAKELLGKING